MPSALLAQTRRLQPLSANGRAVEFTLTPTGPLVDGSQGAVIVKEAPLEYPSSVDGLYGLRYPVQAHFKAVHRLLSDAYSASRSVALRTITSVAGASLLCNASINAA
jgi:hypothetical protein